MEKWKNGGEGSQVFLEFLEGNFILVTLIVHFSGATYPIMFITSDMILSSFSQFSFYRLFGFSCMELCPLEWIAAAVSISS